MNDAPNAPAPTPGQVVWTIGGNQVTAVVVKKHDTGSILTSGHGNRWQDCWFTSESEAKLALAAKLREQAAAFLREADRLSNG